MRPHSNHENDEPAAKETIGPYQLIGRLGRGGMAEVYLGEHRYLGQVRAVKVLLPEISARPGFVGRLLNEARATAKLDHPAIVQIFDCDTLASGGAFIAMEYLEGEPAGEWLHRSGGLAAHPEVAAAMTGVVADALAYAHRQGVIHRDIKPDNIFLVPDPADRRRFSLKVLDFGVAKLLREEPLSRTAEGSVLGTPIYMAPEQWTTGAVVDQRADIYALGCVFFELLTGRPPFDADTASAIMEAHLHQPPPPLSSRVANAPRALEALLLRMLAKAPDDRPPSMEEVLLALEGFLGRARRQFAELLVTPAAFAVSRGRWATGKLTQVGVGQGEGPIGARVAPTAPAPVARPRTPVDRPEAMLPPRPRTPRPFSTTMRTRRRTGADPRLVWLTLGLFAAGAIAIVGLLTWGRNDPVEAVAPAVAPARPAPPTLPPPSLPAAEPAPPAFTPPPALPPAAATPTPPTVAPGLTAPVAAPPIAVPPSGTVTLPVQPAAQTPAEVPAAPPRRPAPRRITRPEPTEDTYEPVAD